MSYNCICLKVINQCHLCQTSLAIYPHLSCFEWMFYWQLPQQHLWMIRLERRPDKIRFVMAFPFAGRKWRKLRVVHSCPWPLSLVVKAAVCQRTKKTQKWNLATKLGLFTFSPVKAYIVRRPPKNRMLYSNTDTSVFWNEHKSWSWTHIVNYKNN